MGIHYFFQSIVSDLEALDHEISRTLPITVLQRRERLQHLTTVHHRLQVNRKRLAKLGRRWHQASTYPVYYLAVRLLEDMSCYIEALEHLAAEYPIDPTGTMACFNSLQKNRDTWPQTIQRLRKWAIASQRRTPLGLRLRLKRQTSPTYPGAAFRTTSR